MWSWRRREARRHQRGGDRRERGGAVGTSGDVLRHLFRLVDPARGSAGLGDLRQQIGAVAAKRCEYTP
jgi:hypothetical protein